MNCPYCNKFSPSSRMCVHCGEKLPSAPNVKSTKSGIRFSGNDLAAKIIYALILIGVLYGAYSLLLRERDIPSYMFTGSVNLKERIVKGNTNIVDLYSKF